MRVKHDRRIDRAFAAVNDDPASAIRLADAVLDDPASTDRERACARWGRGMARRERGELGLGAEDLFAARQAAAALGDLELAARIDTTLALVALFTGSADGALEILAQAEPHLRGADLARLETQRGLIRHRSGDLAAAEADYRRALRGFDRHDDDVGRARLLLNLGIADIQRGALGRSERRLEEAEHVAARAGQRLMVAGARHNLGYARSRAGRLPEALDDLARAESAYTELGRYDYAAMAKADIAQVLLRSNLLEEATDAADRALDAVRHHGTDVDLADTALLAARCRLASGRLIAARAAAAEGADGFDRQRRSASLSLVELIQAEIDAVERPDASVGDALAAIAERLERHGWSGEAMSARALAVQLLVGSGDVERAAAVMRSVRDTADRPAGERATVHLARGLLGAAQGDRRRARESTRRGLRIVAENQATLGATDVRTFAAGHGEALVELGVRLAVADHRPRELLVRVEATRMMLWLQRPTAPLADDVLATLLADLRVVTEDLRTSIASGIDRPELRSRRLALEGEIRDHTRRGRGVGDAITLGVAEAIGDLGEQMLAEYAIVGSDLYVVTVADGRARLHELGPIDGLAADVDACTFALHRLNRMQGSAASRAAAAATLTELGTALAFRLVPNRIRRSSRPVVVVPAGALHGLAWGALAGFAGRPLCVAPSLIGWAVARRRTAGHAGPGVAQLGRVLLAAGPGLSGAAAEVAAVSALYRRPTVLAGGDATAARTMSELGRSDIAHLACHGSFRADNPLFSTLALADGPLTVYDLERCDSMPRTIVVSACNVAMSSVLRGGTLLGLANALMTFGAATVIAPLTPVNDERVVGVMTELHRSLAAGRSAAEALADAAFDPAGDVDPTAAAFVAIGA